MYKPFLDAVSKQTSVSKDLDAPISGSGRLGSGIHVISVASIDMDRLPLDGSFEIQVEGTGRASSIQRMWLMTKDNKRISPAFIEFVNALFLRPAAYDRFVEVYRKMGDQAFNLFRGLKARIIIAPSPGFSIQVLPSRKIVVLEVPSGRNLTNVEYVSVSEARAAAEARGYRRSFTNITKWEVVDELTADTNWEAFSLAANTLSEQLLRAKAGATLSQSALATTTNAADKAQS